MRKLILITVLMLASASAFAGQTRSLTLASNEPLVETSASKPTVDRAAVSKVAVRLAQAAAPANTLASSFQEAFTAILRVRSQRQQVGDAEVFRTQIRRALQTLHHVVSEDAMPAAPLGTLERLLTRQVELDRARI